MRTHFGAAWVIALVGMTSSGWAQEGAVGFQPDLSQLQETVRSAIEKDWEHRFDGGPPKRDEDRLEQVEFLAIQRETNLISAEGLGAKPEQQPKSRPVYVVHAIAHANWWKESLHYLFVLRPAADSFDLLMQYSGQNLRYEVVNIDDADAWKEADRQYWPRTDLLVRDYVYAMCTMERDVVCRYDSKTDRFYKVFDEVIEITAREGAYESFKGAVEFRRVEERPSYPWLKDIVISTDWFIEGMGSRNPKVDHRTSVFHWNGHEYEGQMDIPEQGKPTWDRREELLPVKPITP